MKQKESDSRAVVVTGAGSGIGFETALWLAKQGYRVFAGVHRKESISAFDAIDRDRLLPLVLDVSDDESIAECVHTLVDHTGDAGLYGLINNAAIWVGGPLEFVAMSEIRRAFDVNFFGLVAMTQASLPLLRRACPGRIVNISSLAGVVGVPTLGPYSASKSAVESFSDCLRVELRKWQIPVTLVQPGVIATPMHDKGMEGDSERFDAIPEPEKDLYAGSFEKRTRTFLESRKRAIPPERVARLIAKILAVKQPRARYSLGPDAPFIKLSRCILPVRIRDKLFGTMLGF